jgi:hypothetical protein
MAKSNAAHSAGTRTEKDDPRHFFALSITRTTAHAEDENGNTRCDSDAGREQDENDCQRSRSLRDLRSFGGREVQSLRGRRQETEPGWQVISNEATSAGATASASVGVSMVRSNAEAGPAGANPGSADRCLAHSEQQ